MRARKKPDKESGSEQDADPEIDTEKPKNWQNLAKLKICKNTDIGNDLISVGPISYHAFKPGREL